MSQLSKLATRFISNFRVEIRFVRQYQTEAIKYEKLGYYVHTECLTIIIIKCKRSPQSERNRLDLVPWEIEFVDPTALFNNS